jgi:hypothetical protein
MKGGNAPRPSNGWRSSHRSADHPGAVYSLKARHAFPFLAEGAECAGSPAYLPILVDCDDETRSRRLLLERKQPELANERMMNWARYLRHEAMGRGCEILDTSMLSLDQCILHVMARLSGSLASDN